MNILLDRDARDEAREYGLNFSRYFERQLKEFLKHAKKSADVKETEIKRGEIK